jgi:ribonuclease E
MTRKRVGAGLLEAFSTPCECCNGRGVILTFDPDSDGHATQHTHSRGHGNGGHGNGGHGNGGRGPSPALVAARARSAESAAPAESSAPAEPSASGLVGAPPADATGAPAPATVAAAASALVPASADSADPNAAAQVANGQVSDAEPAPARSSGRRRRRKPAAATAPATPAGAPVAPADAPARQADTPEAPTTPEASPAPEALASEAFQPATVPVSQDGADGMPATHDGIA